VGAAGPNATAAPEVAGEIEEKPKPKPRPSMKMIDLVSVLQESLNKTKKSHHARKSSAATRHRKAA